MQCKRGDSLGGECTPYESGKLCVICATILVRRSTQSHDVVPSLLHQKPEDPLNAVADEGASKLIGFFFHANQLHL